MVSNDVVASGFGRACWRGWYTTRIAQAFWVACAIICLAGPASAADVVPYIPSSDGVVLEQLPSNADARVRQFNALRRQAAGKPANVARDVALARSYLDYGRATGDARYLGRAQAVIVPLLMRKPAPVEALLVQATILQSRHQFAEARAMLTAILARDRDNPQAWLTLSSVALVQGDMREAQRDCAHLIGGVDALVTAGCIGARASVTGAAESTLQLLTTLLAQEPNEPPELQSWAHGLMADAAKYLDQNRQADDEFKKALKGSPGDNYLLADYGDFLLDHGRAAEALALVKDYSQSDTSFLRQVLAESALGMPIAAEHVSQMASRFHDLEQRGDSRLYGREEARFVLLLLHDPKRALKLARDNWRIQRAPEDMRVLMEAALAAGQPRAASPVVGFMATTHFQDRRTRALADQVSRQMSLEGKTPEPER